MVEGFRRFLSFADSNGQQLNQSLIRARSNIRCMILFNLKYICTFIVSSCCLRIVHKIPEIRIFSRMGMKNDGQQAIIVR